MKILIAADMEGISGVTKWDQVDSSKPEYARFQTVMTGEVNAAARGALDAGADEVVAVDGHADGSNILIEELDARVRLNTGNASPLSMVQGIGENITGVYFIGYHARAGSQNAVLAHTWSNRRVGNLWLNDILVGEYGLNAAVCGHFGVPVLMITGDQTACAQAVELLGPLEVFVVKQASGFYSAECLSPEESRKGIYATARRAVERLKKGDTPEPFVLETPVNVRIEFLHPTMADKAMRFPKTERLDGRRIAFRAVDMLEAYLGFRAVLAMT